MKPDICPNCGTLVPDRARSCPECGADEETGWSDQAQAQRLGLPDDEFNYDEFAKAEFGDKDRVVPQLKPRGLSWVWWVAGVLLILAFLYGFLRQVF